MSILMQPNMWTDPGRAILRKGIHKWDFPCSVAESAPSWHKCGRWVGLGQWPILSKRVCSPFHAPNPDPQINSIDSVQNPQQFLAECTMHILAAWLDPK